MQRTVLRIHRPRRMGKAACSFGCPKFIFEVCRYDYQAYQRKYPALRNAGHRHPCQHNWDSRRRSRKAMGDPASDFCRHLCSRLPGAAVPIGKVLSVKDGTGALVCLPTKTLPQYPSELKYIEKGLVALRQLIRSKEIKSLAIPALGCGLGGLSWADVQPLIEQYLRRSGNPRCKCIFQNPFLQEGLFMLLVDCSKSFATQV